MINVQHDGDDNDTKAALGDPAAATTLPTAMPAPVGRYPMNAFLSRPSRDGWKHFAARHGVTFTGLLEVIGLDLAAGEPVVLDDELVERAREVDNERRDRTKKKRTPE
jgi:hypothetical protein